MKLNKMLTMSRRFLYLILGVAALFVLTVVGLISYVGFNIATESEGLLIGGLGGRAGEYFGQSSLEERIAGADVIARVRLRSVSSAVEQLARKDGYYGALEHHFQVLEYMHGRGSGKLVAVAYDPGTKHTTARAASARGNALRDNRDTRWDNREAIIFLTDAHPELPSSNQEGRYWFGTVSLYTGEEYYTIASRSEKRWLPAASAGEALGASGTSGGGQHFLLDAPAAPIGASGAAGQSGSAPTITLADMKAKIAANDREVAAGGGSEAYKECFYLKLKWEREVSYRKERLKGTFEDGRDYYYKLHSHTIRSGLPAGTLVYTAVQADRMLQFYGETEPSDYGEFVLRGMDEDLFHPQWPGVAKTSRPLPAEQYRFYYAYRHQEHVICDSLPEDELKRQEVFVTVRAPTGTLHEAFFDPVAIGPAVGADGTNGALTPTTFTVGRVRTSLQSLKWQA
ncbi:MAG: hypothetical protein J4F46_05935 [Dehalococcoidia bacterium]|nr:hypothetical protein [Dehalococcoidia bacterium]